ncbi:Clp protease N-terminal domain-containing protein [Chloroflexota bacterium]
MWRSKKVIVGVMLAVVLLFGSLGGVALADEPLQKFGIDVQELKDKITEVRGEMQVEHPEGRLHHGVMVQVFESFGVDQEAVQAAFEQVRAELKDGTLEGKRGAVMTRVLEILGIEEEEWQTACTEARQAHQFGFRGRGGFRGMGGMRGFGGPATVE